MNHQPLKILLVEDEPAYIALLQEVLNGELISPFELLHAGRLSDALRRLASGPVDVVLLDLMLPDCQGLATYADLHALAPSVPIIVLTGLDDEKLALQAVREGAQDYLVKGELEGKTLARVIRYAIERKRGAEALRQSEEFFRLISENVTDLIAVIDRDGRRLYNSPSYKTLLGDPARLIGSDSFEEIHPDDRERIKRIFQETLVTGKGARAEYRMLLKDGSVRYIESQGSAIQDETGAYAKVVVVSRDITERIEAVGVLKNALSDLKQSHEELKATQRQLIEAEKLEAVSTFASGVAHEVKNPLQTVILGVDYLSNHVAGQDATAAMVLTDMGSAVMSADGIIRGLLEFSSINKRELTETNLSCILELSLRAVEQEAINYPITLVKDLATALPPLRLDVKTMKHVFINLLMHAIREMPEGGRLLVKTFAHELTEEFTLNGRPSAIFKVGETLTGAAVEELGTAGRAENAFAEASTPGEFQPIKKEAGLGLTVLKKIIELYGGVIDVANDKEKGSRYTVLFKAQRKE